MTIRNQSAAAMGDLSGEGTAIREALRDLLVELSENGLSVAEIDFAADIFDYGYVDSLTAVAFLARIEERYGVQIEDMDLVERLNTLDAIAAHLAEAAEGGA